MYASKNHSSAGRSALTALAVTIATLCISVVESRAQVELLTASGTTGQDFNGLLSTPATPQAWINDTTLTAGDSTLNGWSLFNFSLAPLPTYTPGTGGSNGGSFYSFGSATTPADRALGGVGSGGTYYADATTGAVAAGGAVAGYIAFAATNNSTSAITSFEIEYDGEQWRNGGNTAAQRMDIEVGFGATFATTDFVALSTTYGWASQVNAATAAAVDGNAAGLVANRGGSVNFLNWTPGTTLWIRFVENNDAGNDHGLAIDNFDFDWTGGVVKTLTWKPTTGVWDSTDTNWEDTTPAASAFANGDAVSFTDAGLSVQSTVTVAAGGVTPSSISVSNTSGTYTLTGGTITALLPLQKSGDGTLVLDTIYTSGVNATGGTVRTAADDLIGNTSKVTLGSGATLDLDDNDETVGKLDLTSATITTGFGTLTVASSVAVHGAATSTTITGQLAASGSNRIAVTVTDGAAEEDLVLDVDLVGGGRFAFTGTGTVRISGDNSGLTGGTPAVNGLTFGPGIKYILDTTTPFGSGQLQLNGGTIENLIPLTGGNKVTGSVSFGNAIITGSTTSGAATFTGEDIDFAGAVGFFSTGAKSFSIAEDTTVRLSGTITGVAGGGDITKLGLGTMVLAATPTGTNLYTGAIRVEAGELIADIVGALGSGAVTVAPAASETALLTINASQKLASLTIGDGGVVVLSESIGAAPLAAVPEPGSLGLVALGTLSLLHRRRSGCTTGA